MRFLAPSLVMLSLAFAAPARADHGAACKDGQCSDGRSGHLLSFLRPHRDACGDCEQHKLHSLLARLKGKLGHCKDAFGHGHCKIGECGYHPWFHTFKTGPGPESAFPTHPFVRSPRDFFMYDGDGRCGYSSPGAWR